MEIINSLQKDIYEALSEKYDVYDVVNLDEKLPFIRIADYSFHKERDKACDILSYDIKQEIHIWSDYKGKKEINMLACDVVELLEDIYYEFDVIQNEVNDVSINDFDGYKQATIILNIKLDL